MADSKTSLSKTINKKALAVHRKRFMRFFPKGFYDQRYIEWEHTYKSEAHKLWQNQLGQEEMRNLLRAREYLEIGNRALQVESRCTFLFSFEKMALRDALRNPEGARVFAQGIYDLLYERGPARTKFIEWIMSVASLPRVKSRVLSWPILTFFPYIAQPSKYMIMKPTAMRLAASELGFDLEYSSKPSYTTYSALMELGNQTKEAIADLRPRNYHDVQTFLWVIGSSEYDRLSEEI